jgi:hypothetical protein
MLAAIVKSSLEWANKSRGASRVQVQKGDAQAPAPDDEAPERDHFYVQAKLARLRNHADQVRSALVEKKRNVKAQVDEAGISRALEDQAHRLEQGIAFATKVLRQRSRKGNIGYWRNRCRQARLTTPSLA